MKPTPNEFHNLTETHPASAERDNAADSTGTATVYSFRDEASQRPLRTKTEAARAFMVPRVRAQDPRDPALLHRVLACVPVRDLAQHIEGRESSPGVIEAARLVLKDIAVELKSIEGETSRAATLLARIPGPHARQLQLEATDLLSCIQDRLDEATQAMEVEPVETLQRFAYLTRTQDAAYRANLNEVTP